MPDPQWTLRSWPWLWSWASASVKQDEFTNRIFSPCQLLSTLSLCSPPRLYVVTTSYPSSVPVPTTYDPSDALLHHTGVAASIAASITHPLDLTKVRLQTSGDKGMIKSIKKTVAANGVRGLFDGLTGTLLRQMTYSMMRFAVYDEAKKAVHTGPGPIPAYKMALAGSIAGGVAGVLGNPAELMMVRMQADKAKPPEQRYNYRNSVQGLYRMTREEGFRSWGRGVVPNGTRAILMNMSQLASYDWFKEELIRNKLLADGPICHFVASVGAGTVATTVCSPADVLKSRIMNAHGAGTTSTLQVIKTSLANEGPMFMFKGWVPAWTRLQPTTILIFVILEQLKAGVDKYRAAGGRAL